MKLKVVFNGFWWSNFLTVTDAILKSAILSIDTKLYGTHIYSLDMNMNTNIFKNNLMSKINQLNVIQNKKREFDLEMDRCNESSVAIGASLQNDIRAFLTLSQASPSHTDPDQEQRRLENLSKLRDLETELGRNQEKIVEQARCYMNTMQKVTEIQNMLSTTIQAVRNVADE